MRAVERGPFGANPLSGGIANSSRLGMHRPITWI